MLRLRQFLFRLSLYPKSWIWATTRRKGRQLLRRISSAQPSPTFRTGSEERLSWSFAGGSGKLRREHGNQTRAAKRLGIVRQALRAKLEKHGIRTETVLALESVNR